MKILSILRCIGLALVYFIKDCCCMLSKCKSNSYISVDNGINRFIYKQKDRIYKFYS